MCSTLSPELTFSGAAKVCKIFLIKKLCKKLLKHYLCDR
jgi:hypothetical protein